MTKRDPWAAAKELPEAELRAVLCHCVRVCPATLLKPLVGLLGETARALGYFLP